MKKLQESVKRSITKAITFRFILAITHRFDVAIGVIFFSNIASTIIYFLHERLWTTIHWGQLVKE